MIRLYSTLAVVIVTLLLSMVSVKAIDTNIKVGKYRVGINYSPLIACAVWPSDLQVDTAIVLSPNSTGSTSGTLVNPVAYYNFRAANAKEYLNLSLSVIGKNKDEIISIFEKADSSRLLTQVEKDFCIKVAQTDLTVLKAVPADSEDRPTRKLDAITKTKFRVPDSVLCEGAIIRKYRTNDNWHKVVGLELTTRCGRYSK